MERNNIEHKDNHRGVTPSISLSNVLWIMVTVVSVASFIFTFDTRISVIEQKIKNVPITSEDVGSLQLQVSTIQNEIPRLKRQLEQLQSTQVDNTTELEQVEDRIRELEYKVQDLEKHINQLQK